MVATNKAVGSAKSYEVVVIESDGETSVIPLGVGQSMIGSDISCQVLIADSSVAPQHAEILITDEGDVWLRDVAGQQSTLVNGQITDRAQLEDGTFIKVGLVDLSIRERGANSGQHGTMIRDSSAGLMPGVGPSAPLPPPAVTPLRQSTVQRAYKGGTGPVPPHVPPGGTVPGIKPASLTGLPSRHLTLEDDPEEGGSDPTYMRGVRQLETFAPGSVIADRYKIIAKLAEGGMGEVYKAEHIQLEMMVAIKVMKRELSDDAAFVDRFTREAKAASRIGQQNICGVTDMARTSNGQFFFVMEFLEGQTLGALIREKGAMPVARAIHIFMQLCQALASAHHAGIVHRDLKPENVMVLQRPGQADFVKVLDFGVAKIRQPNENQQTQIGMVVGTPQYMAPEQASGLLTDARTDIYALGLIFYEMLAGKPTFSESTAALLMAAQIYRTPAPLQFGSGDAMPEHVQNFVMHMLQKKPEGRPQTMEEVITALQSLQEAFKSPVKLLATPAYTPPVRPSDVAQLIENDKRKIAAGQSPGGISGIKLKPPSSGRHKSQAQMPPLPGVVPQELGEPSPTEVAVDTDLAQLQAGQKSNKGMLIGAVVGLVLVAGVGGFFAFGGKEEAKPLPPAVVEIREPPKPQPPPEVKPQPPPEVKPAGPTKVKLSLKSEPPGAEIHRDGAMVGSTPMDIAWEQDKTVKLVFKLTGYKDFEKVMAPAGDMTIDARLIKAGGTGPKKSKPQEILDNPYGGQTEDLKDAPF
jgi:eukaryotic-like serine/threonine-protein kinase